MAVGDLWILHSTHILKRNTSGDWAYEVQSDSTRLASAHGLTKDRDGVLRVVKGGSDSTPPSITTYDPSVSAYADRWADTALTRNGEATGIAIDASGRVTIANSNRIWRVAANNPILSPAPPTASIKEITINMHTGTLAICSARGVWELINNSWVARPIPTSLLRNTSSRRNFSAISYDQNGVIWIFNIRDKRFYRKATDHTWTQGDEVPTSIGGFPFAGGFIDGIAFDQGAPAQTALKNINLGSSEIDLKVGTENVDAIYLGDTKIFG